jgi:hypothetical protein
VLNRTPREVTVSLFRLPSILVVAWFGIITLVIAVTVAVGQPLTAASVAGWLALGCISSIVLITVVRGRGPARLSPVVARSNRVTPKSGPVN